MTAGIAASYRGDPDLATTDVPPSSIAESSVVSAKRILKAADVYLRAARVSLKAGTGTALEQLHVVDVGSVEFLSPILVDGFESGDTSAWSVTAP